MLAHAENFNSMQNYAIHLTTFVRDIIFSKFLVKSPYGYDTIVEQKRSGDGYDG